MTNRFTKKSQNVQGGIMRSPSNGDLKKHPPPTHNPSTVAPWENQVLVDGIFEKALFF